MRIRDWPIEQRPRERLLAGGAGALSDAELLAVLLRTGTAGKHAVELARELLAESGGLRGLIRAESRAGPGGSPGLGPARRAQLQAAVELARRSLREELRSRDALASPTAVREFLTLWLRDRSHEVFAGLFLDAQNRLIAAEELFRGTLTQTAVYPREVARRALELNSAALILAHNHPSGVAEPSAADRLLTQALKAALSQLDVPVLDHLIVAGNRC
ncbi:MAG: DNA repair protein RadC, partial [Burkholderiaceae bacterium]|nr:DNA repair protein RadC [Burkholderiaceae bacterium]